MRYSTKLKDKEGCYMAKAKRNKSRGVVSKFMAMDSLSKSFIIGFMVAGLVMISVTVNYVYTNAQAYLRDREYEDPSANFIVVPPEGWTATTPSRSNVEKTIIETTDGGIFDVTRYSLKDEIVPVVLVEDATASANSGVGGSSYISIALRGYDSSKDRLYDQKYCEEYLGLLLEELDVETIKYTNSEILDRGNFNGTFVQAEAEDKGIKVYYSQYQEIIGSNVLTLTFGTTKSDIDGKDYINDTLKHLKFKVLTEEEFMMDVLNTHLESSDTDSSSKKENKYKNSVGTSTDTKNTSDDNKADEVDNSSAKSSED